MKKRGVPSTNFCERLDREQLAQLALANAEELLKNLTGQYFRAVSKPPSRGRRKREVSFGLGARAPQGPRSLLVRRLRRWRVLHGEQVEDQPSQ